MTTPTRPIDPVPFFTLNGVRFILTGPHTLGPGQHNPDNWPINTGYYLLSIGNDPGPEVLFTSEIVKRLLAHDLLNLKTICQEIALDPTGSGLRYRTR